jgi:hypothetical protein
MNSHQRRKLRRRELKACGGAAKNVFIRDWNDLALVPESDTHVLEIDLELGNGWIKKKGGDEKMPRYLSTHTFYGSRYKGSTALLRRCGFNVTLANWDSLAFQRMMNEAPGIDPLEAEQHAVEAAMEG